MMRLRFHGRKTNTPSRTLRERRTLRSRIWRWTLFAAVPLACLTLFVFFADEASAQQLDFLDQRTPSTTDSVQDQPADDSSFFSGGPEKWTSPDGLTSTLKIMLLLTVLSIAPAILLMTTSFIRIVVVLGLLRQALGTQQSPPSQVITSIALFLTILLMTPVWSDVYNNAIKPYTESKGNMSLQEAWSAAVVPIKRFMSRQIDIADNSDDVWMFLEYLPEEERSQVPQTYEEVPMRVLLPAFMLSELKTAFLIGFQIYLPFLILDIVIASVTISMGMLMLPPVMISLPFKLMLFVIVDGWNLVVGMLLESFAPYT